MAEQAALIRDVNAAENELAPLNQAMHIVALPDANCHFCPRRISPAMTRSAG